MDIDALAALAANTVVATAVTDAFEGLRAKIARVFGRDKPDSAIQRRVGTTRLSELRYARLLASQKRRSSRKQARGRDA